MIRFSFGFLGRQKFLNALLTDYLVAALLFAMTQGNINYQADIERDIEPNDGYEGPAYLDLTFLVIDPLIEYKQVIGSDPDYQLVNQL